MIRNFLEVWFLVALAFSVGCTIGALLYWQLADSSLALVQGAVADQIGENLDRLKTALGLGPAWRSEYTRVVERPPPRERERGSRDDRYDDEWRDEQDWREPADAALDYEERESDPPPEWRQEPRVAIPPTRWIEPVEDDYADDAEWEPAPLPDLPPRYRREAEAERPPEPPARRQPEPPLRRQPEPAPQFRPPVARSPEPEPEAEPEQEADETPRIAAGDPRRLAHTGEVRDDGVVPIRPAGLSAPRGGVPDNLTRIRGIGVRNEAQLNSLGIYHFGQIAAWTPGEVRWIGQYFAFPERIERDDWVGQAMVFATGGDTGFEKSADRRRRRRLEKKQEMLAAPSPRPALSIAPPRRDPPAVEEGHVGQYPPVNEGDDEE